MSKTAQYIIIILAILLLGIFSFAGYSWVQKTALEKDKTKLIKELDDFSAREKTHLLENSKLKDRIAEVEKTKADLEKQVAAFKGVNVDELDKEIRQLKTDRDDWKKKVDAISAERDRLVKQLTDQAKIEEVAAKQKEKEAAPASAVEMKTTAPGESIMTEEKQQALAAEQQQDSYWATVLKEKADMQLRLDNLAATLNATNVELVELKKKNSDIQLALSEMKNEKDAIEREIKHGKDLADSLSLELARAQNEKKFLNDRLEKLLGENSGLRDQIKQLSSTKIALEKSIVRLQDEKKEIEKKLIETENVIQSRVDQIWSIKESLDRDLKPKAKEAGQVELPPIVVSSQTPVANPSIDKTVGAPPGFNGNIVSINKDNNFVIVDVGEADGLRIGDSLSVYRGTQYIAGLEVIQLRKDIAAADIKDRVSEIQIGDVVR